MIAPHPAWRWSAGSTAGLLVAVAAIAGVALTVVATGHGPGLSPDATLYLSGARNLAAGRGFVDYSLRPITQFPPGFSLTLAVGQKLGVDAGDGARWLNAGAFGVLVVLTFVVAHRHVASVWLAVAAAAAVACAAPLLNVFSEAWTEPVFCVVALALVLVLELVLDAGARRVPLLVGAAALASAGFADRYAGVALLGAPIVVIGVAAWPDGWAAVLRRLFLYLACAAVVPVVVVVRNLSTGSTLLGPRGSSLETLGGVVRAVEATWRSWVVGGRDLTPAAANCVLAGVALVVVTGLLLVGGGRAGSSATRRLLPLLTVVVGYVAYLAVSELVTNLNVVDDRLLAPVFAPLVILFFVAIERLAASSIVSRRRWVVRGLVVVLGLWLALSLAETVTRARHDAAVGQGYGAPSWVDSRFVAASRRVPVDARTYSNFADGLYAATGRQPVYDSPAETLFRSPERAHDLATFRRAVRRSRAPVYLVWLTPNPRDNLLEPEQLVASGLRLRIVAVRPDTTIYTVTG